MKRPPRGTTLTEYGLILALSCLIFGIASLSNLNSNVDNTYKSVISSFGDASCGQPANPKQAETQWQHWANTRSILSQEDMNAGKLSKYAPDKWLRLDDGKTLKYEINPNTGKIQFQLKDPMTGISGNTTSVEGSQMIQLLAQELKNTVSHTEGLTPQEAQNLSKLAQLGFEIAARQEQVDTQNPHSQAYQNAYRSLPQLYAQFSHTAQNAQLSEQTQPLAAFITSVTYYNYLTYDSVSQSQVYFSLGLYISSLYPPAPELDITNISEEAGGTETHQAAELLSKEA